MIEERSTPREKGDRMRSMWSLALAFSTFALAATGCGKKSDESSKPVTAPPAADQPARPPGSAAPAADASWVWYCGGSFCDRSMARCRSALDGAPCQRYTKLACYPNDNGEDDLPQGRCLPDLATCRTDRAENLERDEDEGGDPLGECQELTSWPAGWDQGGPYDPVDYPGPQQAGLKQNADGAFVLEVDKPVELVGQGEERRVVEWPIAAGQTIRLRVEGERAKWENGEDPEITLVGARAAELVLSESIEPDPKHGVSVAVMLQADGQLLLAGGPPVARAPRARLTYRRYKWNPARGEVETTGISELWGHEKPTAFIRPIFR